MQGSSLEGSSLDQPYNEIDLRERLWRVFSEPVSSFAGVLDREGWRDWCVPVLAVCLVMLAGNYITLSIVADVEGTAVQEQMQGMSELQRQQFVQYVEMYREHGWIISPLVEPFFFMTLLGLVLLIFTRFLFNREMTLRQALIVKAYASLIVIPETLVRTGLILALGTATVSMGPGVLLSDAMAASFLGKVLSGINVFDLWQVWVVATGLHVLANVPLKRAVITLGVLWGLWIVGGVVVEIAGMSLAPAAG